jgi:hypothetical protein
MTGWIASRLLNFAGVKSANHSLQNFRPKHFVRKIFLNNFVRIFCENNCDRKFCPNECTIFSSEISKQQWTLPIEILQIKSIESCIWTKHVCT